MKKIVCLLFVTVIFSCTKDKEYTHSFYINNKHSVAIDVSSSVSNFSRLNNTTTIVTYDDHIESGQAFLLREKTVWDKTEDIILTDYFDKIEIYSGNNKSNKEVMDIKKWEKNKLSDTKIQYTLQVDSTYF
ncbi:MAG: hypothetical protein NT150_15990 [Bacteroidetes bacterium]|nr:hypothetical protein [Bacteroidota bacterium]